MPVTTASPLERRTLRENAFGTVSVVMIASAAENQSLRSARACGSPATIRSTGSGSMMTPVEKGSTCAGSQSTRCASASHTRSARFMPSSPVPAFALPVLTTRALVFDFFDRFLLQPAPGAAQTRFCVNPAATSDPGASRMTSRSFRFALRTPAMATPSSTPGTGCRVLGSGGGRLTAISNERSGQFPVAMLVLLPRAAGAGIIATDLLDVTHDGLLLDGDVRVVAFLRLGPVHAAGVGVLRPDVFHVRLVVGLQVFLSADLDHSQVLGNLQLHRLDHGAEQLEGLALVLLLRVLLRVAPQVDPLAQVIESGEVLAPVRIEDLQRHVALVLVERYLRACRNLRRVGLVGLRPKSLDQDRLVQAGLLVEPAAQRQLEGELGFQRALQPRDVPLLLDAILGNVDAKQIRDHACTQLGDALRHVVRFEQLVGQ